MSLALATKGMICGIRTVHVLDMAVGVDIGETEVEVVIQDLLVGVAVEDLEAAVGVEDGGVGVAVEGPTVEVTS